MKTAGINLNGFWYKVVFRAEDVQFLVADSYTAV